MLLSCEEVFEGACVGAMSVYEGVHDVFVCVCVPVCVCVYARGRCVWSVSCVWTRARARACSCRCVHLSDRDILGVIAVCTPEEEACVRASARAVAGTCVRVWTALCV